MINYLLLLITLWSYCMKHAFITIITFAPSMITSISTVESCRQPTLDSKEESPLEVLSRAATMVRQESQQAGLSK
ncbi:hypothetical protein HUJ04_002168 [Dendroctonus ponderosae]|nr:hypothetical protein HUJ04_002168 [Dendroctonus ponderosae]